MWNQLLSLICSSVSEQLRLKHNKPNPPDAHTRANYSVADRERKRKSPGLEEENLRKSNRRARKGSHHRWENAKSGLAQMKTVLGRVWLW